MYTNYRNSGSEFFVPITQLEMSRKRNFLFLFKICSRVFVKLGVFLIFARIVRRKFNTSKAIVYTLIWKIDAGLPTIVLHRQHSILMLPNFPSSLQDRFTYLLLFRSPESSHENDNICARQRYSKE